MFPSHAVNRLGTPRESLSPPSKMLPCAINAVATACCRRNGGNVYADKAIYRLQTIQTHNKYELRENIIEFRSVNVSQYTYRRSPLLQRADVVPLAVMVFVTADGLATFRLETGETKYIHVHAWHRVS